LSSALLSKQDDGSQHPLREPVQLQKDIFERFVKFKIYSESEAQAMEANQYFLNKKELDRFFNAQTFMHYLLVIKKLLVSLDR